MNQKWLVIALLTLLTGCKQALGERCEVNEDCASGTCSKAVPKVCVSEEATMAGIDASLPIDAMPPDGDAGP